jgi:hypothetical protein
MQPRKAIVIDIPIRKFMNEPPHENRVIVRPAENPVIGRAGDPVIETQRPEAHERIRQTGLSTPERGSDKGLSTREGACATQACATTALATAEVCTRRRGNGTMCGRPADGGRDECWLHAEWYSWLPAIFGMPYPEDAVAIHQILSRTMSMVIGGEISPQKAQAITKLCRELRRNLMWYQREMGMW